MAREIISIDGGTGMHVLGTMHNMLTFALGKIYSQCGKQTSQRKEELG